MKNFVLMVIFTIATCVVSNSAFAKQAHIDKHLTTTGGCDVHIVGDVSYTILPPMITGFKGSISVGPPCTPVVYNFSMVGETPNPDITVSFNSSDPCNITSISWSGDTPYTSFLNSENSINELIPEFQHLCDE